MKRFHTCKLLRLLDDTDAFHGPTHVSYEACYTTRVCGTLVVIYMGYDLQRRTLLGLLDNAALGEQLISRANSNNPTVYVY